MSDLEPRLHPPVLEDPSVTRLMLRRASGTRANALLELLDSVATSVAVVVPAGGAAGAPVVASLADWRPERVRVEVLVVEDEHDEGRPIMREQLARSGRSWRVVARPRGGRAAALAAAAEAAEHEFVLIGNGGAPRYDLVNNALSLMWAVGGDVALVHAGEHDLPDPLDVDDPSATLARWLGLQGAGIEGRLVLMRRWVARWLFNEVTRAISPAEEVADRTRLLGIGIIEVASFASDTPLRADWPQRGPPTEAPDNRTGTRSSSVAYAAALGFRGLPRAGRLPGRGACVPRGPRGAAAR